MNFWTRDWLRENFSFYGVFRRGPAFHLHLLQFAAFGYAIIRFASRDYTVYGLMDASYFEYPRTFIFELWPIPWLELSTFQFVYEFLSRPGEGGIALMQWSILAFSAAGIVGIFPRFSAFAAFLLGSHLTGMVIASNADMDAGCMGYMSLLILALTRKGALYNLLGRVNLGRESVHYHWPVFLFLLMMSVYYFTTGLNKLIDVGPQFPFTLHLDWMADGKLQESLFNSYRYADDAVLNFIYHYPVFSILGGLGTLVGELGFPLILFFPKLRPFLVVLMVGFHAMIYFATGINFLGNAIFILLCLDWNRWPALRGNQIREPVVIHETKDF